MVIRKVGISVVIPTYNEEGNTIPTYKAVTSALSHLKQSYEFVFIDDGSTDNTFKELRSLHLKDKRVKVIRLKGNFGKTVALDLGFKRSRGDVVVQMDADLQSDPKDIPLLLGKLDDGYDAVVGWRHDRKDPLEKRFFSRIFNALRNTVLDDSIHDANCPLRAYRRESLVGLKLYHDLHRYLPNLLLAQGFRVTDVKVRHYKRIHGKSKYGVWRLFNGFADLLLVRFWPRGPPAYLGMFGLSYDDNSSKIKEEL
jgi:glycosyltransferase involved in cell wall biosynthesis